MRRDIPAWRESVLFLLALLLAPWAAPCGAGESARPGIAWLDDYGKTLAAAQKDNRPVMIEFYTSWCLYCGKLEKETFGNPEVVSLAKEFVCAKLDADVQKTAAARYEPEGYPTVVFASPKGEEILKVSGFREAGPFLTVMKAVHEQGPRINEYLARIDKSSKDIEAQEGLGRIYLDLGLAEPAEEHLAAALKARPSNVAKDGEESDEARIQFLLGRSAAAGKDYARAAKIFQKLIDAHPRSPKAPAYYLELGRADAAAGKGARAKETFAKLARLYPEAPETEASRKAD